MSSTMPELESFAPDLIEDETIELVPIDSIVIKARQRKISGEELDKHVTKLARSIQRAGLIHPITLEDDSNELVAGFCRTMAFMKLGQDRIPARRRSQLTDLQKKVLEIEENVQRLGLEWWEKAAAIAEIDALQRELNPEGWNQRMTAEMVGESQATVSQSVQLIEEIKTNPKMVKDHKTLVGALAAIKTKKQLAKRKETIEMTNAGKIKTFPAKILEGDAAELIKQQPDEEFDAIITNFPFGIDLQYKSGKIPYHDEEKYIISLVQEVVKESYRVLKDDSWFVGFFDLRKITYSNSQKTFFDQSLFLINEATRKGLFTKEILDGIFQLGVDAMGLTFWLERAGFRYVTLMPAVWVKPNKRQGIIGDPKKGMIVAYEAFVFATKGDAALLKQGLQNIFIYDTPTVSERVHEVQMSEDLCTQLVSMVALGGSKILDPFAGSGAVGLGALNNQCQFTGFELDPEKASNGNMLLQEHILAKKENKDA